ncbi:tetratricopeptide repeat protein [candidate division TA06 bacterium]|uniref:Tetratricopeptide repeat protein n=1 Tax=candidate division TA06 bacterium TaxID=2250710 RepID=A0A933I957_UNCT6|nr:tetratricopeptide repeat protein [candidate division TA06 bacterium]
MSHQVSKHTLKRDEFADDAIKMVTFVRKHSTEAMAVAAAFIVIIAGLILMGQNQAKSEKEAALMIGMAHAAYFNGDMANAQTAYEEIVSKHGSSLSAKEALVYLGNINFIQRKNEEAIKYYEQSIKSGGSNPLITAAAVSGVAACYEQTGRLAEAGEKYLEIVKKYSKDQYLATNALLSAGRCFTAGNLNDKAKAAYQQLIKDYSGTAAAAEAKAQLAQLPG